ncbi:adenosylcobinamide-phosphate synthase CbiB [Alkalicoccus halolimnae]|uniref:Cobalamin biosynthesis protein CobD n=1 Tax=Alkalicoccus halolimnae TaxID=1667239 RepID=A0A5C7F2G0_9BACI|nr:adenosylcobinamide-phosphate synthase CbiB [Alkalicoccus halolimnae]TXF82780.1 cobalamin biosynthesis protein CobD [Alkalicoccus halolimnae]
MIFYTTGFLLVSAVLVDLAVGDPRRIPHPVVMMGKCTARLTARWNVGSEREKKLRGTLLVFCIVGSVWAASATLLAVLAFIHPLLAAAAGVWLTSTTIAVKGLKEAAEAVRKPLEEKNLSGARNSLSMIVGRDTEKLEESEVVRGTVETVAENTVDGVTAPLFWALIGGAPLALAYRAVNTLDSMVGYKNEEFSSFGWAGARLDDLASWLPARLTAAAMLAGAFFVPHSQKRTGLRVLLRDAGKHPSPNSGWTEALTAGLLGVKLGGINYYKGIRSERAEMGEGTRPLKADDISRSVQYLYAAAIIFTLLCAAAAITTGWQIPFAGR